MIRLWSDCQVFRNGKPDADCWAAVVIDDQTPHGLLILDEHLGTASVNEGEYTGVIRALEWAEANELAVKVITDSQLVYRQVTGRYGVWAEHLIPLRDRVQELIRNTGSSVEWHGREGNKAGWHNERKLKKRRKKR